MQRVKLNISGVPRSVKEPINTMKEPPKSPGIIKGRVTERRVFQPEAPIFWDASRRDGSKVDMEAERFRYKMG